MDYNVRPYDPSGQDLLQLMELIQAGWNPQRRPGTYLHPGDLFWRLRNPEYEKGLWKEKAHDRLLGFIQASPDFFEFEFQMHPDHSYSDLAARMLHWMEQQAESVAGNADRDMTTFAGEDDPNREQLLLTSGYERQGDYFNLHTCRLDRLPEVPDVPSGYNVRHLTEADTVEARVAGHRAGWQSVKMTTEIYERLMRTPGYRRDLDIVVVGPGGDFVATANCWLDEQSDAGLFEPVSVHPEHRRKGLGTALIRYGMAQLAKAGASEAWVCSISSNPVSTRLYESCGMNVVGRDMKYKKSIKG